MTTTAPTLELRHVFKSYGEGRRKSDVVRDCSFALERGATTVMIGPSGAGKSTLVRLIAGFEPPTSGEITCGGRRVTGPGKDRLVVFQESALFPWMTTMGNVLYGPEARGERSAAIAAADEMLDKVGIRAFRARYPGQLSGGMQRRAELARALVNKPDVMILDEPFRGLDALTKRLMLEYWADLSREGERTDLFVTTDVDEALLLADRLLVMAHRPTRVRERVDVDLPRPRSLAALADDKRALDLKVHVLALLHEEALRSFAPATRAGVG